MPKDNCNNFIPELVHINPPSFFFQVGERLDLAVVSAVDNPINCTIRHDNTWPDTAEVVPAIY